MDKPATIAAGDENEVKPISPAIAGLRTPGASTVWTPVFFTRL
jgi:hypothetical protein